MFGQDAEIELLRCSLEKREIMFDPVFYTKEGRTYERELIQKHRQLSVDDPNLIENKEIKDRIVALLKDKPELQEKRYLPKILRDRLLEAINCRQPVEIQKLLEQDPRLCSVSLKDKDADACGAFYWAAQSPSFQVLKVIVDALADSDPKSMPRPESFSINSLMPVFREFLMNEYDSGINFLIRLGFDVEDQDVQRDSLKILLGNPTLIYPGKRTVLHLAASLGDIDAAKKILKTNLLMVNALDKKDNTALHNASKNGHCEVIALLLVCNATCETLNLKGESPLDVALSQEIRNHIKSIHIYQGCEIQLGKRKFEMSKDDIKKVPLPPVPNKKRIQQSSSSMVLPMTPAFNRDQSNDVVSNQTLVKKKSVDPLSFVGIKTNPRCAVPHNFFEKHS